MAARPRRKKATRRGTGGSSPLGWFGAGLVLGLAGAVFLFYKGFLPAPPAAKPAMTTPAGSTEPELFDDGELISEDEGPRYDFFTVLPEMEQVVPERELTDQARPAADSDTPEAVGEQYILQVGSFRSAGDADQMKARLALLGSVATIQEVTVNNESWHRVRIGPVQGARQADELRRRLLDDGIEVLILKVSS